MIATGQVKLFELIKLDNYLSKSLVILVSGKKGVGKTYIAEKLCQLLRDNDYTADIKHFADQVKKCAIQFFNWDSVKDTKGRKLLQQIGGIGREYNEDLWVSYLVDSIEEDLFLYDIYIVDDWRFPNEEDYLRKSNFYVFTVRVESNERGDYSDTDPSEIALPIIKTDSEFENYYDFVIDNDEDIEEKLKTILEVIRKMEVDNV